MNPVPVLPESAPFTAEQRAYLNGFLAGLFSRVPASQISNVKSEIPEDKPLEPLTILFGSQTGNAESLAKRVAKEAGRQGFAPVIHDLAKYPTAQLASERNLLVVTSTYGDGEPPDNAKCFWDVLNGAAAPQLLHARFSVCALGDTNYPKFCAFGKNVDAQLEALGAQRVHPCAECDVDYESPFSKWLLGAMAAFSSLSKNNSVQPLTPALSPSEGERENRFPSFEEPNAAEKFDGRERFVGRASGFPLPLGGGEGQGEEERVTITVRTHSRTNPFPATLLTNRKLNGDGAGKDVRHFEISLEGSDLNYEVGDALGVVPSNCPSLVEEILRTLDCDGEQSVPGREGERISLRAALLSHYEIARIPQSLLKSLADRTEDSALKKLAAPEANGELTAFLRGRDILDLLRAFPAAQFAAREFVTLLRKLPPRLYSIASSPKAYPGQVHLTVSVVRYESLGRQRKGVCSTFLAERVSKENLVPVFVHTNAAFRPPADPHAPLIMVGPGTGIAPFRAFLQERKAIGARGRNWLFFGDQRSATDFLYREEMEEQRRDGLLTSLDLAWSRDQAEKIYVQHRMLEQARELFEWLEGGAAFYVCGDASRMAKDVDAALHKVIEIGGGCTSEQAAEYVQRLRSEKRYQRDVY